MLPLQLQHGTFLHTEAFTHINSYTQKLYTQDRLHTGPFTHSSRYTQKFLHTPSFPPLHTATFTHRTLNTETPSHTLAFTNRRVDTQTLLHTATMTPLLPVPTPLVHTRTAGHSIKQTKPSHLVFSSSRQSKILKITHKSPLNFLPTLHHFSWKKSAVDNPLASQALSARLIPYVLLWAWSTHRMHSCIPSSQSPVILS